MSDGNVADTIELLARRAELLRSLHPGTHSKRDLVDALSVSRSTIDRAVRNLEAEGFVERREGRITITLKGRLTLSAYESLATNVASIDAAEGVLEALDSTATMDVSLLRNANVVLPNPVTPHRPVVALLEHLREATRVRGFATGVLPSHIEEYHEQVVEHGTSVEFVATESVLEEVVTGYADALDEAIDTGRFHVWRANRELGYSLLVVEKTEQTVVCALVYGDRGVFGVVENDDEHAVQWATEQFEELRENADPIPL